MSAVQAALCASSIVAALAAIGCSSSSATSPVDKVDAATRNLDSSISPMEPGAVDSAVLSTSDSGKVMDGDASFNAPRAGCGTEELVAPIAHIPQKVLVLEHLSAPCSSLDTVILIRNTSSSNVTVEKLAAPAPFSASAGELPHNVKSGGTLPVRIRFKSESVDRVPGVIVAKTSAGCKEIPIEGQMVAQSIIVPSAYAFDFGEIASGKTTEPAELTVLVQGEESPAARKEIEGFSSSPAGIFDVVTKPESPVRLGSCDSVRIRFTFTAPHDPGAFEGDVSWGFLSGMFAGEQGIQVFGTALPE